MAVPAERNVEVPAELVGTPGIERSEYEERFFAAEHPLKSWIRANTATRKYLHTVSMPYVNEMFPEYRAKLLATLGEFGQRQPEGEPEPGDHTDVIRRHALDDLGLTMIGFRPYKAKYTFEEERDDVHITSNVLAIGYEQPWEETQTIPSREAEIATVETYISLVTKAISLAEFLLARGHRAQPTIKAMLVQPYFVDAGLGQMGANGQLLTPHAGSRVRLMLVLTDAQVTYDQPVDYGIAELCNRCQVCVTRCPGRALTSGQVWWRGVRKFKTVDKRCVPMLAKYDNCGVCMKVCPVQRYGYHEVMEHFEATGEILGKGTDELEGYTLPDQGFFGAGEMPKFTAEDFVIPTLEEGDEGIH